MTTTNSRSRKPLESIEDLLTDEQRDELQAHLNDIAAKRRRAMREAATTWIG